MASGETRQSTLNLLNSGTDPVTVDWLELADIQSAFSLVNPPTVPIQLAANARTQVTVAFSPVTGDYSNWLFASSSLIEGLSLPGGSASVLVDGSAATLCQRVSVSTIAGTGQMGRMDGPANTATFMGPAGIAIAANGDVFLADGAYPAIRRISNGTVSTFSTTAGNSPSGLAIDASGGLYVSGIGDCRIFTVDATGAATLLAGSTTCGYQDGTGANARFQYPYGIAVHANGTAYVADSGNRRIRAITPAGETTTLAGSGANGSVDGVGTAASFGLPSGLALVGNTLYVTDYTQNTIRQIDVATRRVTTRLPSNVLGPQGQPAAIVVDALGNLIVMTHGGDTLNLLPAGSSNVQRLAGNPNRVPEQFADGPGCDARFDDVEGLALAGTRLVMGDLYNLRVRQATIP